MCDIFISYSHKDKDLLDQLRNFLKPFEKRLNSNSDRDNTTSDDWQALVKQVIEKSRNALLLIAPDFLSSEYIGSKELPLLVQAAEEGRVTLAVLYLKTSLVANHPIEIDDGWELRKVLLTQYQGLNSPQNPVAVIDRENGEQRNQLYLRISQKLAELTQSIADLKARFLNTNEVIEQVREKLRRALPAYLSIGHILMRGNSSLVYCALNKYLDRPLVIKGMDPSKLSVKCFERRSKAIRLPAGFKHRSIVSVYNSIQEERLLYTVSEYVDDITLADLNRKVGVQPVVKALKLVQHIGSALKDIHLTGCVHGRLGLSNVTVDHEGWPILSPFKILDNPGIARSNGLISLESTKYRSREQYQHADQVSVASDQYRLGLIACERIAGEPMIRCSPVQGLIAAKINQLTESPPSLTAKRANYPPAFAAAIERMLEKAPHDRWLTLSDALTALRSAVKHINENIEPAPFRRKHSKVVASYERLLSEKKFFQAFYARVLLKLDDILKAKLPMHMEAQYRMLREAIDLLPWFPAEISGENTALSKLSEVHARKSKLQSDDYERFRKCLLLTVRKHDPEYDKSMEKALAGEACTWY